MNKKLTKRDHFNALLAIGEVAENATLVDFINHELELLAKKNSAERKPSASQVEGAEIKNVILSTLTTVPCTITDLQKANAELGELSNQRVSALMRQLVTDGSVIRTEEKKKAFFALAE